MISLAFWNALTYTIFTISLYTNLVHGGVSEWSEWKVCEKPCGTSNMTRVRTCTKPKPQYGGNDCNEVMVEQSLCELPPCPGNIYVIQVKLVPS